MDDGKHNMPGMDSIGFRHLPSGKLPEILPHADIAGATHVFTTLSLVFERFLRPGKSVCLSFVDESRYLQKGLSQPHIKGILLRKRLFEQLKHSEYPLAFVVTETPYEDFFRLHEYLFSQTGFYRNPQLPGKSHIGKSIISPGAVVEEGVVIGDDCVITDKCVIRSGVIIGNRVRIQQGAIIGSIGFEPKTIDGRLRLMPHDGTVIIGDDVEIGANTVIDRGIYGMSTRIGNSTLIDNLVHIGHNDQVGERCRIVAGAAIGGGTVIGDDVWIGPGAVVSDSLMIGDGVRIQLGSVVIDDVVPSGSVSGNFAVDHRVFMAKWFQMFRLKNKLPKN